MRSMAQLRRLRKMNRKIVSGVDAWYPQVDGVTNVVKSLSAELEKNGDSVKIVVPSYGKKADEKGDAEYCAGVFHNRALPVPFMDFRNSMPGSDKKLKKLLDEFKPDILHAHSPFAVCAFFCKYGKKHGIPVVYTFHTKFKDEFMRITHSRILTAVLMKIIMRNINRVKYVWAVSRSAAEALKEYGYKGEIKVMRNGTDMKKAGKDEIKKLAKSANKNYCLLPEERVLLFVGRIVSVKNVKFALRVIAVLKSRGFDCKFIIAGAGNEIEADKKYAKKLGIASETVFTGFIGEREKLAALYARADLMLFPSVFDSFGLVIREAAAYRTPVFVPEGSASAEEIENGVNGYTAPMNEKVWADRIEKLFDDGHEMVCERCSELVHAWEEVARETAGEYEKIAEAFSIGGKDVQTL